MTPTGPGRPEAVTAEPPDLTRRRVLDQRWDQLAYFHWRYRPEVVQALLPPGVTVDVFDGSAWVGLIPFVMRDVRVGPTPPLPWLSTFVEINVRTYVVDDLGRRCVWFFSLDVPRSVIVAVARSVFALPYCWARARHHVEGDRHRYELTRRWPRPAPGGPSASMAFTVGERIPDEAVDDLDHFLTARWALLTARRERLLYGRVRHPRWPLHEVRDVAIVQDVVEAAGLPAPAGEPLGRYSPGVDVSVSWLEHVPDAPDGR
jgi:uncharacterized protein YqjF (DUF2071 family)